MGQAIRTTDPSTAPTIDAELVRTASMLRERAASLRAQAESLSTPLATAYRRRASELELEAWLDEVAAGVPDEQVRTAA